MVGENGAHAAWLLAQHADLAPFFETEELERGSDLVNLLRGGRSGRISVKELATKYGNDKESIVDLLCDSTRDLCSDIAKPQAAALADRDMLLGAALIGVGVAVIGIGAAALAARDMLLGAAAIGFGAAGIGLGVAGIGPGTVMSAVRRVVNATTRVPPARDNQEPAQQEPGT
jgi:hypothetical protein